MTRRRDREAAALAAYVAGGLVTFTLAYALLLLLAAGGWP